MQSDPDEPGTTDSISVELTHATGDDLTADIGDQDGAVCAEARTVDAKAVSSKPPSKRNTPCGYPGCKFNGVNIKRHMRRVHPEKPIHIRGSGFEPNGRFSHWITSSQPGVEVSAIYKNPSELRLFAS